MGKYFVLVHHREFEMYCGIYKADSEEGLAERYMDKHFASDLSPEEREEEISNFNTFTIEPEVGSALVRLQDFHPHDVEWVKERATGAEEYCAGVNDGLVAFLQQFEVK